MTRSKEEPKKPLDMTTDEAINFLFPKQVVEKLKSEANPKPVNPVDCDDFDENDSAYQDSK